MRKGEVEEAIKSLPQRNGSLADPTGFESFQYRTSAAWMVYERLGPDEKIAVDKKVEEANQVGDTPANVKQK
jgi:hypothetical protein